MQWEKRIHKSLNSMCTEIGIPLSRFRLASDRDEMLEKWNELSNCDVGMSCIQFVNVSIYLKFITICYKGNFWVVNC